MAAVIQKNETADSMRQIDLFPVYVDGALTLAARSVDFIALGILFVPDPAAIPHLKLGAGTCVNKRKPLVVADFVFTATAGTDQLNKVAHGLETGDGPVTVSNSGGALPAPLTSPGDYWVIKVDADNFYLATSLANAYANTRVDITTNGTGTQTLSDKSTTQRGIDGFFVYTFTQAETNTALTELSVLIEGSGYSRASNGGIYATANLGKVAPKGFDDTMEGSLTYGDGQRLLTRGEAAPYTRDVSGNYVHKKLDGVTDSHSGTVTSSGRAGTSIINPGP
jgi:hypothetical protein